MKQLALLLNLFASLVIAAVIGARSGAFAGALAGGAAFVLVSALLTPRAAACYSNNFGVLNNTIVIHDAFNLFLENLLPLRSLVLDTQDERTGSRIGRPGDTITVKDWRTAVTAYQPVAGAYAVQEDINISARDRQLTLPNTPWAVSMVLTAAEYRLLASGVNSGKEYTTFRDKLAQQMVNALGIKLIDLFFAVITTANYPDDPNQFVSATGTFSRSVEVDLDTALFTRNVPRVGAQVICSPALYAEWVKDHTIIQNYTGENRPKGLLMGGGIQSQNSDFTFWRTNRTMPAEAARGFALGKTGVIAAFRVPDEATYDNDPVSLSIVTEPVTDIPMLSRLWKNASTGQIQMDLAMLPVFGKGQQDAVERIEATA